MTKRLTLSSVSALEDPVLASKSPGVTDKTRKPEQGQAIRVKTTVNSDICTIALKLKVRNINMKLRSAVHDYRDEKRKARRHCLFNGIQQGSKVKNMPGI